MLSVRGLVSIDAQVEVLIVARSQMSIDEEELVSVDTARFSLWILHSKRVGSEFVLAASGTTGHVPEKQE